MGVPVAGAGAVRWIAAMAAALLIAGCGRAGDPAGGASSGSPPSGPSGDGSVITSGEIQPWALPEDPDSLVGLPPMRNLPPKVRPETHVMDDEDAAALEVTLLNGEACISRLTLEPRCQYRITMDPRPAGVVAGTVLATGVTPATPAGLLVRVEAVEGTTITAREASLGEALEQGEFRAEQWLEPDDVVTADLAPGVTALPEPVELGRGTSARAGQPQDWLSQGLAWHLDVDESPSPGVHLTGKAHFNAACGMDAGISLTDGPWFWAGCYLQQGTGLDVTVAKGAAGVGQTYRLADFDLQPITFFVGPVPVVLVPHLTLAVRIDGSLEAGIDLGAEERVIGELKVGYDDGFFARATFDADSTSHHDVPGAGVGSKLGGELGAELMLDGVVGPKIWGVCHVEFTGGPDARPSVCYDLRVGLGVSLVLDLEIDSWEWRPGWIIDKRLDKGCRANEAPTVTIVTPKEGQSITVGGVLAMEVTAKATDPEDGELPVRWTSDRDGVLGEGTGPVRIGLRTMGKHTLTATAVDGDGVTATAVVHVTVARPTWTLQLRARTLAGAEIDISSAVLPGKVGKAVILEARASAPPNLAQPGCDQLRWESDLPLEDLGSCRARLTFAEVGTWQVEASMPTPWGETVRDAVQVQVAAKAPATTPPSTTQPPSSPEPGKPSQPTQEPREAPEFEGITVTKADGTKVYDVLPAAEPVTLRLRYTNPEQAGVSMAFAWSVRMDDGAWQPLPGPDGNPSVRTFSYTSSNRHTFTFRCVATPSSGEASTHDLTLPYPGVLR